MSDHMAFCPKCQALRRMNISTSQRVSVDPEGNTKKILTKTYHCVICHAFVSSEDIEQPEEVGQTSPAPTI